MNDLTLFIDLIGLFQLAAYIKSAFTQFNVQNDLDSLIIHSENIVVPFSFFEDQIS